MKMAGLRTMRMYKFIGAIFFALSNPAVGLASITFSTYDVIVDDVQEFIQLKFNEIKINGNIDRYESSIFIHIRNNNFDALEIRANQESDWDVTINKFDESITYENKGGYSSIFLQRDSSVVTKIAERVTDNEMIYQMCSSMALDYEELSLGYTESVASFIRTAGELCIDKVSTFESYAKEGIENDGFRYGVHNPNKANRILDEIIIQESYVSDVQYWLKYLGYEPGTIDGIYGDKTRSAVEVFAKDYGIPFSGELQDLPVHNIFEKYSESNFKKQEFSFELQNISRNFLISLKDPATDATIWHGLNYFDYDNDGNYEAYLCGAAYTEFSDLNVVVVGLEDSTPTLMTSKIFNGEIPTSNDCTYIEFSDLNKDGLKDVVFSDSGMDRDPWTGTAIEVALNNGDGFTRITEMFEEETFGNRSYAIAVGDLDHDGYGEIILPSGTDNQASQVLQFTMNGVRVEDNPLHYKWYRAAFATNMQVDDIDGDGREDLFVGGSWATESSAIFWSGFSAKNFNTYPDFRFGHYEGPFGAGGPYPVEGIDVNSSTIADFDNDGDLDILNIGGRIIGVWDNGLKELKGLNSYLQILEQTAPRQFDDLKLNVFDDLGSRYFMQPMLYDLNNDGLKDIIQNYWRMGCNWIHENCYGTALFLNHGEFSFEVVNLDEIMKSEQSIQGISFPIRTNTNGVKLMMLMPRTTGSQWATAERPSNITFQVKTFDLVFR